MWPLHALIVTSLPSWWERHHCIAHTKKYLMLFILVKSVIFSSIRTFLNSSNIGIKKSLSHRGYGVTVSLGNVMPIIGMKVQEYGVIMHIKTEWYLSKISQFAVRHPQKDTSQGCINLARPNKPVKLCQVSQVGRVHHPPLSVVYRKTLKK